MNLLSNYAISKYTTRLVCNARAHIYIKRYYCNKCESTICKFCHNHSSYISYLYACPECTNTFCLFHFIAHTDLYATIKAKGFSINCTSHQISMTEQLSHAFPFRIHTRIADNATGCLQIQNSGVNGTMLNSICGAYTKSRYIKYLGNWVIRF